MSGFLLGTFGQRRAAASGWMICREEVEGFLHTRDSTEEEEEATSPPPFLCDGVLDAHMYH